MAGSKGCGVTKTTFLPLATVWSAIPFFLELDADSFWACKSLILVRFGNIATGVVLYWDKRMELEGGGRRTGGWWDRYCFVDIGNCPFSSWGHESDFGGKLLSTATNRTAKITDGPSGRALFPVLDLETGVSWFQRGTDQHKTILVDKRGNTWKYAL